VSLKPVAAIALVVAPLLAPTPASGWQFNGVAVCDTIGSQAGVSIVSDGAGGAVIGWGDVRSSSVDIYAERLRPNGLHEWTSQGVVVASAPNDQDMDGATSDGAGGAIFVWTDQRNDPLRDLWAQRIRADGTAAWAQGGVPVMLLAGSTQRQSAIATDGAGGAIIAWSDNRSGNYDIRVQRLSAAGNRLWDTTGVLLCSATGTQDTPEIVSDGRGGAVVSWRDFRTDTAKVFLQRVDSLGNAMWTGNGVRVCNAPRSQDSHQIVGDRGAGAIVTWVDDRGGTDDVYARWVDAFGNPGWSSNGVVMCAASGTEASPAIVSNGRGGAIVIWRDNRTDPERDLYAQGVDSTGTVLWVANGVAVSTTGRQREPRAIADGTGGAIITWQDDRGPMTEDDDIYVQHVDAFGGVLWEDGLAVSTAGGAQSSPAIASDGQGGAIVTWADARGASVDVYAQRVGHDATIGPGEAAAWTPDGTPVTMRAGVQQNPSAVSDGKGGALIAWEDYGTPAPSPGSRPGESTDGALTPAGPGHARVRTIRVQESGETAVGWSAGGDQISSEGSDQVEPATVSDGRSGAIVVWKDNRNGNFDIFAQRVLEEGMIAPGWPDSGHVVCDAAGDQQHPVAVADGAGGAIVCWEDRRSGTNYDIYAVRISADGGPAPGWTTNGKVICGASGDQLTPVMTADGTGGAIIAWADSRANPSRIFFQHVTATGQILSPVNGSAASGIFSPQVEPSIAGDGEGGAFLAWTDSRFGNADIYGQHVNYLGAATWPFADEPLCNSSGSQSRPAMVSSAASTAIVIWEDQRSFGSTATDLYATSRTVDRVAPSGWIANGNPVCTAVGGQLYPQLVADGLGGVFATWVDQRSGSNDIWAMQINSAGGAVAGWPANGFPLSRAGGSQEFPRLVTDGSGGAIVAWTDGRVADPDIYAMHLFGPIAPSPTSVPAIPEASGPLRLSIAPNPALGRVAVGFELASPASVDVDVLDVAGRRIRAVSRGVVLTPGRHRLSWEGRDDQGRAVRSGLYFVRVRAGGIEAVRRLVLLE
jgi:hypothetical protein